MMAGEIVQRSRYSSTAIALHWLIALLLIGNLVGGGMLDAAIEAKDYATATEIGALHKPVGILILLLTLWRLALRLRENFMPLPAHMKGWEVALARLTHVGFYVLLLIIPLSGWAFAVSAERPLAFFSLFPVPDLGLSEGGRGFFHEVHEIATKFIFALALLHIAGAVKHHVLDRDDVVARMLPFLKRG
jgi:cytochrome b561